MPGGLEITKNAIDDFAKIRHGKGAFFVVQYGVQSLSRNILRYEF